MQWSNFTSGVLLLPRPIRALYLDISGPMRALHSTRLTWGLTTPEKPVPAPMDMLSVYMVKQAISCLTRLGSCQAGFSTPELEDSSEEMLRRHSYVIKNQGL